MYRLTYGGQSLHDPIGGEAVTDASLTAKTNAADYLDFAVAYGHPLYGELEENAENVELWWDGMELFRGLIESIETDIEGNKAVSCRGGLSYLEDTIVRAYSTLAGEQPTTAPSSPSGLFEWFIEQHNAHCNDSAKEFVVGVNQGDLLDSNAYIYRSSSQNPTTWSEVDSKLLDSLGGYVSVDYGQPAKINWYADVHETNAQIIDFGVNITDFCETVDASEQYTAVYAQGYTPDAPEDDSDRTMYPIDLSALPDGTTSYSGDIYKQGDRIYSQAAVARYGYREYAYKDEDCTTEDGLLLSACKKLESLLSPSLSITVKAVDLSLFMEGYTHLKVGQAVRIRSRFHGIDEYMMVSGITLDLNDPSQTEYELGASYGTLTGQQSSYLKSLTADATKALDASSKAVVGTFTEYATSTSPTEAPASGWSQDSPTYSEGKYIWMRQTVKYGGGNTQQSEPVVLTGSADATELISSGEVTQWF